MKVLRLILGIIFTLWLAGCGGGGGSGSSSLPDNTDLSNRIYVMVGESGNTTAANAGHDLTVTLTGVLPQVAWYHDRPGRLAGISATQDFAVADWQRIYGGVAPNALLQFEDADGLKGLFGSIQNVAYNGAAQTVRFTLHMTGDVGNVGNNFKRPVLTVLNNLTPPAEGSAFGIPTKSASVEQDNAGGWRLVLQGVNDQAIWMNNGPSRAADFESVGDFVNHWPDRFGQVLPNASVVGDPGDGTFRVIAMTLSQPSYDSATHRLSFAATALDGPGDPAVNRVLTNAVLVVDAGARNSPADVFSHAWRGVAYSPIPSKFSAAPTGAFFDSDMTADNFQAIWGSKNGCGRNDLEAMAAAGINLVRLYDYNFQRGTSQWNSAGTGHIAFLDKAQLLGIKVIIPISNYNFRREAEGNHPWENIQHTVTAIVESVKKNGAIHPAVHSFSIGNELDLGFSGMQSNTLIPDAVRVAGILHQLAPDHYMTVPVSNAKEASFYEALRKQLPPDLYKSRFYNSVQTFKLKDGDDLRKNILQAYDNLNLGVPLVITELGTNAVNAGSVDRKIDAVIGQASAVREYMDATPQSQVKGFAIFQWQNANWKGGPGNVESTYGINAYDGTLCSSNTGKFFMQGDGGKFALFHDDQKYDVDKLVPLTSPAHPEGLLQALSKYFK